MSKIIVKSVADGFRRAGIAFNREGVVLDAKELTTDQLAAIKAEPMLIVADYAEPKKLSAAEQKAADAKKAAEEEAAKKAAEEEAAKKAAADADKK